jgi:hypothetical protein
VPSFVDNLEEVFFFVDDFFFVSSIATEKKIKQKKE